MTGTTAETLGRPVVAAFDVDGTLTVRDCMVPFLERLAGRAGLALGVTRQTRAVVGAALHMDRDRFKAVAVRAAYAGREERCVERIGGGYADTILDTLIRPDTRARLSWHQRQGHRVVLVSASLGAYLRPLGRMLGVDGVLCSEVSVGQDGRYTGELIDGNCRGPEKARRLRAWLGETEAVDALVWAYGDSRGDRELLLAADHPVNVKGRRIPEAGEAGP